MNRQQCRLFSHKSIAFKEIIKDYQSRLRILKSGDESHEKKNYSHIPIEVKTGKFLTNEKSSGRKKEGQNEATGKNSTDSANYQLPLS